jgi:hypothetical protein
MRRSLFGFLAVLMVAGILITAGCERANVLRVVNLNDGKALMVDIADFYRYFDKVDSEWVTIYVHQPDTVLVELQYVDIGLGLPTWTPYQAIVNKVVISYKSATEGVVYDNVTMPMTQAVMADREGKKTVKFHATLVPAWWKEKFFGDDVIEPPDYDILDHVEATIKFTAIDSVSGREIVGTGKLGMEIGNFYDDEGTIGK